MPEELPSVLTPLTTEQALQILQDSWKKKLGDEPKVESLRVLCAQWALETDWGKSMYCYNFGNVEYKDGDDGDWTYYRCNAIVNGKRQLVMPKHPKTRFRAFRSLSEGVETWLAALKEGKGWEHVAAADA